MSESLLEKYDIIFSKPEYIFSHHDCTVTGGYIALLLEECKDPDNLKDAIEKVKLYLGNGIDPLGDNSIRGEVFSAYLTNETVKIFFDLDPDPNNVLQEIPLNDFCDILMMWQKFLLDSYPTR